MTSNNQINYVMFEVDGISRQLDSAVDYIRFDEKERMAERMEVALYAFRTAIDRLHAAHDRLEEALRMLRVKQCVVEDGKNAENGKDDQ